MRLTCLTLAAGCLWCSGCGRHELEHNAFPLALGIGTDESRSFHMYAAYPDLQGKDAKENVLAKDLYWDGAMDDLLEGTVQMSEGSSRNVNLNHLKVLILERDILESGEKKEELVTFFQEKRDAAWNSYVLLCDGGLDGIFSGELELNSCLGIYLEDLIEGWTHLERIR